MAKFLSGADEIEVPDDAEITLRVDGADRKFSLKTLSAEVSKGVTGDRRLQDASEKLREAEAKFAEAQALAEEGETGSQFMDLLKRAEVDDDDGNEAFREIGRLSGMDDKTIEERLMTTREQQRAGLPVGGASQPGGGSQQRPAAAPALTKEQEARLNTVYGEEIKRAEAKALSEFRNAVDKDPQLGKLKDEQKDLLVSRMMRPTVESSLRQGSQYGPDVIRAALEDTRKEAEKFGILPGEKEEIDKRLGFAEQAGVNLGPSDQSALATAVRKGEVPDRVPASDPSYEDNFVMRGLMQADQEAK